MTHPDDYDPDGYDPEDIDRQARAEWYRDRANDRVARLLARRPPAFDSPGALHPDIETWRQRFLAGEPGNLVLVGPVGVGKSWSLWKLVEHLYRDGWAGRAEIVDAYDIREAAAPPTDYAHLRRLAEVDLLALDDFASQRISEWDADQLTPLVDRRWKNRRPVILTSNETNLKDPLGPRMASRLRDVGTVVQLAGDDRRGLRS